MAEKKERIAEFEREMEDPGIWEDRDRAVRISRDLAHFQEEVGLIEGARRELDDLLELARISRSDEDAQDEIEETIKVLEEKVRKEELSVFFRGKHDRGDAVLSITAGAGGQDAQDWAAILSRMYQKYAESRGWRATVLHESLGDPSPEGTIGIKSVTLEVEGRYAYGLLRRENGVHRLVRLSPFSSQSLRHTSFASVEVLPKIDAKEEEIEIAPEDIDVEFFRSSGPGGQNVNKRETAVRVIHKPTGIAVNSQASRTQQQNREKAMELLAARLYQMKEEEARSEAKRLQSARGSIEWGHQIRSYVLHPYRMVKDHRTNMETSNVEKVLEGDLDPFIEAALAQTSQV